MIRREHLRSVHRKGIVYPQYLSLSETKVSHAIEGMHRVLMEGLGEERAALTMRLRAMVQDLNPQAGNGLIDIALHAAVFEGSTAKDGQAEDARKQIRALGAERAQWFELAAELRAKMPADAQSEHFETALAAAFSHMEGGLTGLRQRLYADLPARQRLLAWPLKDAALLVSRYNMALMQGLVAQARKVVLSLPQSDGAEVRRVLRWLKFCRLLPRIVERTPLTVQLEGPAGILAHGRAYGLHLARFVSLLPALEKFTLKAEVPNRSKKFATLTVSEADGLVSEHNRAHGHIPEEVRRLEDSLGQKGWQVDGSPWPRPVGLGNLFVPDLEVVCPHCDARFVLEVFHRWHRGGLGQRLQDLEVQPDAQIILAAHAGLPNAASMVDAGLGLSFRSMPTARGVLQELARRHPKDACRKSLDVSQSACVLDDAC